MQWLSSVYNKLILNTYGTLPDKVVILRYQAEGCQLCLVNYIAAQMIVSDELMIATGEDQPMGLADDISSDGGIGQMM